MVDISPSSNDFDKVKESNEESQRTVNKALIKSISGDKCPKCHNHLEKFREKNEEVFGYFSYLKCPVWGWNTKEKESDNK
ncbi:MAG: hypothetical protein WC238_06370 [Parcubacteria group bacterium]|jgi:hypothetical protein